VRTSYSLAQFLYAPVFYKGKIVAGRKSPNSLYDPKIATMEGEAQHTTRAMPPDLSD